MQKKSKAQRIARIAALAGMLFLFVAPGFAFADVTQADSSAHDSGGAQGTFDQALGKGLNGSATSFTFIVDDPTFWTTTTYIGSYITLSSCTVQVNSEQDCAGNGGTRIRNEVDGSVGGSISALGDFVTVTFPTPITLNPSLYYDFAYYGGTSIGQSGNGFWGSLTIPSVSVAGATSTCALGCTSLRSYYFVLAGAGGGDWWGAPPAPDLNTHIVAVTPYDGQTVATSSNITLGAEVYVNAADIPAGGSISVRQVFSPYIPGCSPTTCNITLTYATSSPGDSVFSTTTPTTIDGFTLPPGTYALNTSFYKSTQSTNGFIAFLQTLGIVPNGSDIISTSTTFVYGYPSASENQVSSTTQSISDYLASSTADLSACVTSFDFITCADILFTPPQEQILQTISTFRQQFLSYYPWGFVTRFFSLLSSNATSTLPSFTVNIAMPYSQGGGSGASEDLTFNEQQILTNGASALNGIDERGGSLNWQGVLEPFVQLFIAITLLYIIVHDLIGTARHGRHNFSHPKE